MSCPIPDLAYCPLLSVFTYLPNSRCVLSSIASSIGRCSLLCHSFLHFCLFQGNPSKGKSCPEKKHLNAAPYLIPNGRQINCLQLHKGSKKLSSSINPKLAGTQDTYFSKIRMIFLSNSYFSGLSGSNMSAFSYNPKKNVLNPAVKENYLNSFLYADFFASRGGSKRLQTKKEPGKRSKNVYRAPWKPLAIYFIAVSLQLFFPPSVFFNFVVNYI